MVLERFAGGCIFGSRVTGIAHYDEELRELRLFGLYASGADLYYVIGTRR